MLPMETQQRVCARALGAATANAAKGNQASNKKDVGITTQEISYTILHTCIASPAGATRGNYRFETLASLHDFAGFASFAVCKRALGAATTNAAKGNQASTKKHVGITTPKLFWVGH